MSVMDKSIVRLPVYAATGIAFLFASMAMTFPDDEVKEIIVVQAEKAMGGEYRLRIASLDLWWLTGVTLEGVTIEERVAPSDEPIDEEMPADLPVKINLAEVSARLAVFPSLFALAPVIEYQADVGGGEISGDVTVASDVQTFTMEFDELDLRKTTALMALTGVPFFGTMSGEIELSIDPKKKIPKSGSMVIDGSQLTLGPATIQTDKFPPMTYFEIPQTNFGTLKIDMGIDPAKQSSKMNITRFTTNGRDIRTEAWGDVELASHLKRARPNIETRLQLDEGFVKKNSLAPLLNVKEFRKGQNKDWYGFVLYGTLGKIQFKGSSTAARGPSQADEKSKPKAPEAKKAAPSKTATKEK